LWESLCYSRGRHGEPRWDGVMIRLSGTFSARLGAFSEVRALLQEFGLRAGLCRDDALRLTLIVEELFTNTVHHGHGGDCDAPVDVILGAQAGHVELTYQDTAPQYDPLAAARHGDVFSPLELRPVGGLGMLLTLALSSAARYSYVDGRNRVDLTLARGASGDT
jgi:anti-sigma regulatory factor (Ser/Thr protein kinase)